MPYYISSLEVLESIDELMSITPLVKGNKRDSFAYFLIFSHYGINKSVPKSITDSEILNRAIFDVGGVFSPNESAGKKSCVFFTSFNCLTTAGNSEEKEKCFFNKGTRFLDLAKRIKDTADNSLTDFLLDVQKDGNNKSFYTFRSDIENTIRNAYDSRFKLSAVLKWLYRYYGFEENELNLESLFGKFLNDYNLSENQINELFDYDLDGEPVELSGGFIEGNEIRNRLGIETIVEVEPLEEDETSPIRPVVIGPDELHLRKKNNITYPQFKRLLEKRKQVILCGVPGVGKSYLVDQIEKRYENEYVVKKIQFHPNYTYQDFVWGQVLKDGNIVEKKGEFLEFLKEALSNPDKKYILFLDEINRANTSSVFGELLHALDRDKEIKIRNGETIKLPDNFHIVGTMNTADRSIALVDYAVRRRFWFVELLPDYNLIDATVTFEGEKILGSFLRKMNEKIVDTLKNKNFMLGHSYFLSGGHEKDLGAEDVYEIFHFKLMPMIEEYCHSDPRLISEIVPENLRDASIDELLSEIREYVRNKN